MIMEQPQQGTPVYKGLQKPLEFMGIRGRFLTLAAAAVGCSFMGFIVASISVGKLAGLVVMVAMIALSFLIIYVKQKGGLHNKRRDNGIAVYSSLFKH